MQFLFLKDAKLNNMNNYHKKKNGFTLVELILSTSISLSIILVGFYVLKNIIEGNKIDEIQFGLNAEVNDALDFIIDEVESGERIIDEKDDITSLNNSRSYPSDTNFVFGIKLPDQALVKNEYKQEGDEFNLNQVDCPIVYSLRKIDEAKNKSYSLIRYGPQFNEKGFYVSPSFTDYQTTSVLENISMETDYKKIICPKAWKSLKTINGISFCTDKFNKSIELQIQVKSKNNISKKPNSTLMSSGGFSRVQDESQISLIPSERFNGDAPNCIGGSCCFMGICLKTRKIIFMLDISESMNKDFEHKNGEIINGKWQKSEPEFIKPNINGKSLISFAISSLKDHLNRLPILEGNEVYFQIIAYNDSLQMYPKLLPKKLSKTTKLGAFEFLDNLEAKGSSDPWEGICSTLQDETTEQIILISSGIPSNVNGICAGKNASSYDDYARIIEEYNRDKRSINNQGSLIIDSISYFHNFCESNKNYLNNNWMGKISRGEESECIHIK